MIAIAKPLENHVQLARVGAAVRVPLAFRLGVDDLDVTQHLQALPSRRARKLEPVRVVLDAAMQRWDQSEAAASDS